MTDKEIKKIILNETLTMLSRRDSVAISNFEDSGSDLYTSDELKKKFKYIIDKQPVLQGNSKYIHSMIDNDIIVPVSASKNFIDLIKNKIFPIKNQSKTCGFYSSNVNKIFIILDKFTSFLFFVKSDEVSSTLVHEIQHFSSEMFPSQFLNLHKSSLIKYYNRLIELQFMIKLSDDDTYKLVHWIYNNIERKGLKSSGSLVKYAMYLENLFKKYVPTTDIAFSKISPFLSVLKLYLSDLQSFITALHRGEKNVIRVYINLHKSYQSLGISNIDNTCIQELWLPTEVICIESQYKPTTKHFKFLSQLKG